MKDREEDLIAYIHSNMLFGYEKLRAHIVLSDELIIADCKRPDSGKDKIFSDFIRKRFECD